MTLFRRYLRTSYIYFLKNNGNLTRLFAHGLVSRYSWLLILLAALLYNEWLCYRICYSFGWPTQTLSKNNAPDNVMKVLIVADPQIQGYQDEPPLLGIITRWDADRYLANGYSYALSYTNPDLVVFLGDLIDEGSRAGASEYKDYVKRVRQIFFDQTPQEKLVLPGDNDVGGEGSDIRTVDKVLRFEKYFSRTYQLVSKKFVDFFMLDYTTTDLFTSARLERVKSQLLEMQRNRLKRFSVILNHENILPTTSRFYTPIFEAMHPNLILTAHSHYAFTMRCLRCWDQRGVLEYMNKPEDVFSSFHFSVGTADVEGVVEIGVPTCSYRMGVSNMAFGVVTMNSEGLVQYHNLWLPSRFLCLFIYVVALVFALLSYIAHRVRSTHAHVRSWNA